jgi:hypothetical protein
MQKNKKSKWHAMLMNTYSLQVFFFQNDNASVVWFSSYNSHILSMESILRKFLKFLCFREDGVHPRIGFPQQSLLQRFEFNSCLERVQCSRTIFVSKFLCNDIDAAKYSN